LRTTLEAVIDTEATIKATKPCQDLDVVEQVTDEPWLEVAAKLAELNKFATGMEEMRSAIGKLERKEQCATDIQALKDDEISDLVEEAKLAASALAPWRCKVHHQQRDWRHARAPDRWPDCITQKMENMMWLRLRLE
jgi:hypothetical protein